MDPGDGGVQESEAKRQRILQLSSETVSDGVSGNKLRPEVAEVYSPPRIAAQGESQGMKGGWSLDLTTVNDAGERWDFNDPKKRAQAKKLVQERKPRMLTLIELALSIEQVPHASYENLGRAKMYMIKGRGSSLGSILALTA